MSVVNSMFDMHGKNVLLTGATGHLGGAMAKAFCAAGANVLVNSRSSSKAVELVESLVRCGGKAEIAVFDVRSSDSVEQYFSDGQLKALHVLVNNAYAGRGGTIESSSREDYSESYEIGLIGVHTLVRAALPALRSAVELGEGASVINIASMYGVVAPDLRVYDTPEGSNPPFYGAVKAALVHWTRYAACEFGKEGIRFNSITPGAFPSLAVQEKMSDFVQRLEERIPLGRIGNPEEITGPALFLASNASSYVNGANLVVDGGWTCW